MLNRRRFSGLALAAAAGLPLVLIGCGDGASMLGSDGGRVRFVLSASSTALAADAASAELDGPAATDGDRDGHHGFFESANVTLSSILARNLEGVLMNVGYPEGELPTTVDVVALDGGKQITLPEGTLPPATYDQVVLVMTEVQGVTFDGTTITIEPPGGGWTAVVPICQFTVEGDVPATVELQFDLRQAFSWRNNRYHFKPYFTCESETDSDSEDTST
jgi:hypothetical protein